MQMMKVTFGTENAAFRDLDGNRNDTFEGAEICRILREIISKIETENAVSGAILDINGNRIGRWQR